MWEEEMQSQNSEQNIPLNSNKQGKGKKNNEQIGLGKNRQNKQMYRAVYFLAYCNGIW